MDMDEKMAEAFDYVARCEYLADDEGESKAVQFSNRFKRRMNLLFRKLVGDGYVPHPEVEEKKR